MTVLTQNLNQQALIIWTDSLLLWSFVCLIRSNTLQTTGPSAQSPIYLLWWRRCGQNMKLTTHIFAQKTVDILSYRVYRPLVLLALRTVKTKCGVTINTVVKTTLSGSSSSIGTATLWGFWPAQLSLSILSRKVFTECRCQRHVKPPTWRTH